MCTALISSVANQLNFRSPRSVSVLADILVLFASINDESLMQWSLFAATNVGLPTTQGTSSACMGNEIVQGIPRVIVGDSTVIL
jgi:hypothetical protein